MSSLLPDCSQSHKNLCFLVTDCDKIKPLCIVLFTVILDMFCEKNCEFKKIEKSKFNAYFTAKKKQKLQLVPF